MPTQRDVARLANVSSATVSRFLANPGSVRPDAAEKVRQAILDLDYQVDYSAQTLKTGRYYNIGILAPGIGPFYWDVTHAIQSILNDHGYFSSIFFTRDIDNLYHSYRNQIPPFLQKRHVDGLIFFPLNTREDDQLLETLLGWERPFVVMDRQVANSRVNQVSIDNYQAGKEAARILLELGHRDFVFIWGTNQVPSAADRFQGFSDGLKDAGINLGIDRQLFGDFYAEPTYQAARRALPHLPPFTAVFASNDSSAVGFVRAAHEYGLHCPGDYSIIGFDNNQEYCAHTIPSLSTFFQPLREYGIEGATRLLRLINGETLTDHRVVFPTRYIARESVGPRRR